MGRYRSIHTYLCACISVKCNMFYLICKDNIKCVLPVSSDVEAPENGEAEAWKQKRSQRSRLFATENCTFVACWTGKEIAFTRMETKDAWKKDKTKKRLREPPFWCVKNWSFESLLCFFKSLSLVLSRNLKAFFRAWNIKEVGDWIAWSASPSTLSTSCPPPFVRLV